MPDFTVVTPIDNFMTAATPAAMRAAIGAGAGDVTGPASATSGHIAAFLGTTGKVISDPGIVPIESVSTSAGAADAGKLAVLNGAGQFDASFIAAAGGEWLSPDTDEIIVTAATALTIGRWHRCFGTTADYTCILPDPTTSDGQFIGVIMGSAASLTQLVTIDGDGALIDDYPSLTMWSNEAAVFKCDGNNWNRVAGKLIPMICIMARGSIQTGVATGTATKVILDTTIKDNTGRMADLTNNRVNFIRGSIYRVTPLSRWNNLTAPSPRNISFVFKNGSPAAFLHQAEMSGQLGSYVGPAIPSPGIYAAGDFIELNAYQTSGVDQTLGGTGTTEDTHIQVEEIIER